MQTNDILGGLAVRGYGATTWSTGRGQVMYKAAENWTDGAQGTYLQFTTTPIGSVTWVERMRIAPDGKVGIGTPTPAQMLSVAGTIQSTTGGFLFPDGTAQTTAARTVSGNNVAFGPGSLGSVTSGTNNAAFGDLALSANTEGGANTATGYGALGRQHDRGPATPPAALRRSAPTRPAQQRPLRLARPRSPSNTTGSYNTRHRP